MTSRDPFLLRVARPADRDGIVALVTRVYDKYGERICLEQADADLLGVPESYQHLNGEFVVLVDGDTVIGCHAAHPLPDPAVCTFRRLYLSPEHWGRGLGRRLMQWAIDWARERQMRRIEFWSDTRFQHAHAFFAQCGFKTANQKRTMDDGWESYDEFFFWMDL